MKIFFASSSVFGEIALKKMIENGVSFSALITAPDKKNGRGQVVKPLSIKKTAEELGIKIKEADNSSQFDQVIESEKPDMVIVAGFKVIISKETLRKSLFINIHPSLLPEYRGATPIQTAIIDGKEESGVTIIKMSEKVDQGPVVVQKSFFFSNKATYKRAEKELALLGAVILAEKIEDLFQGKITLEEQDEKKATYTNLLKKEDGRINWNESAELIERRVRALNPWPSTYTTLNGKNIKILEAEVQQQTEVGPFGDPGKTYLGTNHSVAVQTGENFLLIKKLQREGEKEKTSEDFIRSNIDLIGEIFK
ncbi:MAG: methionyl-tRNA formyltransferase [Candidatus Pacebacteria bacterium]|nr:methionyl-tRNA formyltransferase [Candidatus Paceibacterota bacterium]